MKKIEIRKLGAKNIFKVTLYLVSVPLALMACIGVIALLIGAVFGSARMIILAIPYIIMPVVMAAMYGLVGMLMAVVYNQLAGKFGGLELVILDKGDETAREASD